MKKVWISMFVVVLALSLTMAFVGCKQKDAGAPAEAGQPVKVVVKTPTGAPSLALGALFAGSVPADGLTVESEVTSGSAVQAALTSGSADFVILPTFAGAQLSVKLGTYQLLATTSWGNLFLVTTETSIVPLDECTSADAFLAQLDGMHVDTIGGGKVDVALKYILEQAKVECTMQAYEDATAITPLLKKGTSKLAMLGEPAATAATKAVDGARIVARVSDLWKAATGADFPQASLFVRKAFAAQNPQAVAAFVNAAQASIAYFNDSAAHATEVANSLSLNGAVVGQCYPDIAQQYVSGMDAKASIVTFLSVLGVTLDDEAQAKLFA